MFFLEGEAGVWQNWKNFWASQNYQKKNFFDLVERAQSTLDFLFVDLQLQLTAFAEYWNEVTYVLTHNVPYPS